MKIGHFEVTGVKKIIVDRKAVWKKHNTRWVKYIGNEAKNGKSELEMHEYLNGMYWEPKKPQINHKTDLQTVEYKYKLWVSGNTINVTRNEEKKKKVKTSKKTEGKKKTLKKKGE
jgi:hypothetical protein